MNVNLILIAMESDSIQNSSQDQIKQETKAFLGLFKNMLSENSYETAEYIIFSNTPATNNNTYVYNKDKYVYNQDQLMYDKLNNQMKFYDNVLQYILKIDRDHYFIQVICTCTTENVYNAKGQTILYRYGLGETHIYYYIENQVVIGQVLSDKRLKTYFVPGAPGNYLLLDDMLECMDTQGDGIFVGVNKENNTNIPNGANITFDMFSGDVVIKNNGEVIIESNLQDQIKKVIDLDQNVQKYYDQPIKHKYSKQ